MNEDGLKTITLDELPKDSISWRINFALTRKYKSEIPETYNARVRWVASKYGAHPSTVKEWLYRNRRPREPYFSEIAKDTGVEGKWLAEGGPNPYETVPYEEPTKLNASEIMDSYTALGKIKEQYQFSYQAADEMLELAAIVLTQHRLDLREHGVNINMENLTLAFGRLLNRINDLAQNNRHKT